MSFIYVEQGTCVDTGTKQHLLVSFTFLSTVLVRKGNCIELAQLLAVKGLNGLRSLHILFPLSPGVVLRKLEYNAKVLSKD